MSKHECGCGHDHEEKEVKHDHKHENDECCGGNGDEGCCGGDDDGCGCGHDHGEMETLTLQTEDGEDVTCAVIGTFDVEGKEYIALLPETGEDVYIYSYTEDGDNVQLDRIETDEEYNKVGAIFMELWGEDHDDEFVEEGENA